MPSDHKTYFDVIIVGAGPAGTIAAYQLANKGLKVGLFEKNQFPRDKVCGDALSPDVINQLSLIDITLADGFNGLKNKEKANGISFFAPNHHRLDINFVNPKLKGYVAKREVFDDFLFQQLKTKSDVSIFQNQRISSVQIESDHVIIEANKQSYTAKIILGADGANSAVKSALVGRQIEKDHYCAGLRQYYEGISGFEERKAIELHFYNELLPGYFWIFPLPNNQANVGIGMLSSEISKNKVNLKTLMQEMIENHPMLKDRFKHAKPLEIMKGFGLPLGSKKVSCSGDRFLLLGDAANLIDPFTGEGIGNAIRSGRIAADHVLKSFNAKRFDAKFNEAYDKEIYRRMWSELRLSRFLQKMLKFPRLFNFLVKKANRNESFRTLITASIENVDLRKQFRKPSFYFNLIFK